MNGWFWASIGLALISIYSISRLLLIRWDLQKMTAQLKNVNDNFGSNELVRTNTHQKQLSRFAAETNQLIHLYKENERYLERRENQLKEEITNISHDLRTPLTSIKGFSQLLLDDDIPNVEKEQYMAIIQGKIKLLTTQVDLFYELSSIDSADYKMNMEPVALDNIIEEKMLLFYDDFQKKGLEVRFATLPTSFILANEKAVERIIINIIQNALRYARTYFEVDIQEKDKYVCLRAKNDTTEITEADLSMIFNRSYQKDQSRRKGQLGLGLHILQQLLQKQGGEARAHLADDQFVLELYFYKRLQD